MNCIEADDDFATEYVINNYEFEDWKKMKTMMNVKHPKNWKKFVKSG